MSHAYNGLVDTRVIEDMKVGILLEAEYDLYYIAHIRKDFIERRGVKDAEEANQCTLQIVNELIQQGFCTLNTWGDEKGTYKNIYLSLKDLKKLIAQYGAPHANPFDYLLNTTAKGNEWVARYTKLMSELEDVGEIVDYPFPPLSSKNGFGKVGTRN